jgi:large conductance mechanosensitive channel
MFKEFAQFLREFNVAALAIGFIMGTASTTLVKSLVDNVVMPIISPLMSGDSWRIAMINIGPVHIAYGAFLAELLNFLILALIIFFVAKKLLKMQEVPRK